MIQDNWRLVRLDELGSTYGGLSGKSAKDFRSGAARYITFLNVVNNVVLDPSETSHVTISPDERQSIVQGGDILFNSSSETPEEAGLAAAVPDKVEGVYLNSFCFGFRPHPGAQLDPIFFAFLSRSQEGRAVVRSLVQGSTRFNVSSRRMLRAGFRLPGLAEQSAIAEALLNATAHVRSLDALAAKKRNLRISTRQRLLSGVTRLGGFSLPWIRKPIGDIAHIAKGVQLNRSQMVEGGPIAVWNGGTEPSGFTTTANVCRDVVTVSEGGSCGWVGRPRSDFWLGGHCYALDPKESGHSVAFLYHSLKSVESALNGLGVGSGLQNIQLSSLAQFEVRIPSDPGEAQAISDILDDIDLEIAALERQRDKAELVKQGMMQELLSGRVRLT